MSHTSKDRQLKVVNEYLEKLSLFIGKFLPITTAHNCDFIVNKFWDKLLSEALATELLALPDEVLCHLPTGKISKKNYLNCDKKGTTNCDESLLLNKTSELSVAQSTNIKVALNTETQEETFNSSLCINESVNLADIIEEVNFFRLKNCNEVRSRDEMLAILNSDSNIPYHISHGMNEKKSHEIEMMTHLCAVIAKFYNIDKVVDIGSGKGYLGCQLAMTHNLKVLGLDSSSVNTNSAEIRTHRVQKYWGGLVRKSMRTYLKQASNKINDSEQASNQMKDNENEDKIDSQECAKGREKEKYFEKSDHGNLITDSACTKTDISMKGRNVQCNSNSTRTHSDSNKLNQTKCYIPVTDYVTSETDLLQLLQTNFCDNKTDYQGDVEISGVEDRKHSNEILLTGLHTCGDLASNILRLFVSNANVKSICSVGCCYHLIEEEFVESPFNNTKAFAVSKEPGFPMSRLLLSRKFQLGRNSRMLACQAPERLVDCGKLPDRSLYWRALLQVILKDLTGTVRNDWQVGRIAAKCSNFKEYLRKALIKLEIHEHFDDEQIEVYEKTYEEYHRKLNAYFQFKALIAPCIETLILLDRWAYLLEQDCTENVYLVQLFDEVVSPRCYAIIGTKSIWKTDGEN